MNECCEKARREALEEAARYVETHPEIFYTSRGVADSIRSLLAPRPEEKGDWTRILGAIPDMPLTTDPRPATNGEEGECSACGGSGELALGWDYSYGPPPACHCKTPRPELGTQLGTGLGTKTEDCWACRGHGHFSPWGKPSRDKEDRACLECSGSGERPATPEEGEG